VAQGYYYFLPKNKDKTLQIVSHCNIIRGCATINITLTYILLYIKYYLFYWRLMTTATILSIAFNFVACEDHTYKAIWTLDIGGHLELWANFAIVVIMTEYIVGYVLKAITYHHLLLKISTCGTIRGYATIKINHKNKVICTRIVMHWATIRICTTTRVNMVFAVFVQQYQPPLI